MSINMIEVKCDFCGKSFFRKPCQLKGKKYHYCSRACLGKANAIRNKKEIYRECSFCHKLFLSNNKHIKRNKHFYCSDECYRTAKSKKVLVTCEWCGKGFLKKSCDIKRTAHNFCSDGCYRDYITFVRNKRDRQVVCGKALYRLLAEAKIGRPLLSNEQVHHIDGNPRNNNTENLQILSVSEHAKIHAGRKKRNEKGQFTKS